MRSKTKTLSPVKPNRPLQEKKNSNSSSVRVQLKAQAAHGRQLKAVQETQAEQGQQLKAAINAINIVGNRVLEGEKKNREQVDLLLDAQTQLLDITNALMLDGQKKDEVIQKQSEQIASILKTQEEMQRKLDTMGATYMSTVNRLAEEQHATRRVIGAIKKSGFNRAELKQLYKMIDRHNDLSTKGSTKVMKELKDSAQANRQVGIQTVKVLEMLGVSVEKLEGVLNEGDELLAQISKEKEGMSETTAVFDDKLSLINAELKRVQDGMSDERKNAREVFIQFERMFNNKIDSSYKRSLEFMTRFTKEVEDKFIEGVNSVTRASISENQSMLNKFVSIYNEQKRDLLALNSEIQMFGIAQKELDFGQMIISLNEMNNQQERIINRINENRELLLSNEANLREFTEKLEKEFE